MVGDRRAFSIKHFKYYKSMKHKFKTVFLKYEIILNKI
jgi:hypothetical protein